MNRFIRISLAALIGFAAPLQAFGWGTVTGPHGGTATTGPRGAGYAQGPNGATAARGPRGAGYAQGPNGGTAYRGPAGAGAAYGWRCCRRPVRWRRVWSARWNSSCACLWRSGLCWRRLQAMGRGTLLRCRRRGRDAWHRNRRRYATAPTVTSLVLVLVQPGAHARVLGLLRPIGGFPMPDPISKLEKQESLPFPPTPSASIAGRTMQESVYQATGEAAPAASRRAEHSHRADRRRWPGPAGHVRRRGPHPDDGSHRQGRDRLQPVPHHGHVLADPGVTADRPQSSSGRQRADRGAGE